MTTTKENINLEEVKLEDYLNEPDTLKFLDVKATTLRVFCQKKLLSKYEIGAKRFYKKSELLQLIESNKKHERSSKEAIKMYQDSVQLIESLNKEKDILKEEITKQADKRFIISTAAALVNALKFSEKAYWHIGLYDSEFDVILFSIEKRNFKDVSEKIGLSEQRVRQIFHKATRKLFNNINKLFATAIDFTTLNNSNTDLVKRNISLEKELKKIESEKNIIEIHMRKILATPMKDIGFSVRVYNSFTGADIKTLGEIISYSKKDLSKLRNLGKESLEEIFRLVESYGLKFNE